MSSGSRPTLADLGERICIMGPSNSGKSTLATAIGRARGMPPIHLDQLHHQPYTDWQPRPAAQFAALHDAAILRPTWVMDGNYSRLLPQRLERATGVILLDLSTIASLLRYLRRSLVERDRLGGLEGARDRVKWNMIHHIGVTTRGNRRRYCEMMAAVALPKLYLSGSRAVERLYQAEGMTRP